MMKLIDLSHDLQHLETVFPGDHPFSLRPQKQLETDGYTLYHLETELHVGTHLDAPVHLSSYQRWIDELPLEACYGDAVVLDVRGESLISAQTKWREKIRPHQIVLLFTGWDQYYGQEAYYQNFPVITDSFTDLLIEKKVKLLGIDSCSPDNEPYLQHRRLLEKNILLLENLTNLQSVVNDEPFTLAAFPIKWHAEASFVRAVAIIP